MVAESSPVDGSLLLVELELSSEVGTVSLVGAADSPSKWWSVSKCNKDHTDRNSYLKRSPPWRRWYHQ